MEDRENWPKWSPFAKIYDPLQSGSIDGTDTTPHDRALIRAMEAKYIPPNKNVATPDAEKTLFVGRLDHKTTEENLKREFSRYGTVSQCRVVRDVVTGFSRGYAFVQFKHFEDAEKARRDAHHAVLDGREILVEWENARTMPGWIPRRLGGGFGGKKESGQLRFGGRDRPFRKPIVIKPLRRERSSNLDEENVKQVRERDRQPAEEEEDSEKKSSRERYQWNDTKEPRDGSSNSQLPRKALNKPWDRRNPGHSRGRGRSLRDRRDGNDEYRRYSRSARGSNEWDYYKREEQRHSSKRDWNEREFSSVREDRRFSKSSRDWNEGEDSNEMEEKRSPLKFSWDRKTFEERDDTHQRKPDKLGEERCKRSRDREDAGELAELFEGRSGKKKSKRSRRSRDREDLEERGKGKVKKEEELKRSLDDMGDWEDTPERIDKDEKRTRKSSRDRDDDDWEESFERSKDKKHSKRSRARSDTDDDSQRKSKKKKKHSKKPSRDHGEEDDFSERKKEKKKKKHKKSRD